MTIQELIDIASQYSPNAEIQIAYGKMLNPISKTKPCIDMDTNVANLVLELEKFTNCS